ncbi:MAG: oxygenase [Caulobacterales bacterium 32-69-10]|nr:MAG: oxygenase [Caulobacterales bacterium 32-69-10]
MTAVLAAQPGVHRIPAKTIELYFRKAFLTPEVCAQLVDRIDAKRRPSTIADDYGIPGFRTSETCDLDSADPVVAGVEAQICALTGLDPRHGEPTQGQRYAVGQEFKLHTDYFEPNGADFAQFCAVAGQRTWTVMIFLNEPEDGGATRFKRIDRVIKPETGKLLAWNNLDANGFVNGWTLHAGMKVRAGTKYVITKWFRQRPWG